MLEQESIVYGVIRDVATQGSELLVHSRRVNSEAILRLGDADDFPHLTTSMFAIPVEELEQGTYRTQVIHFAGSYHAVEYHWEQWLAKFEALLARMYWVSATVHLETGLSGSHTFQWESPGAYHAPSDEFSLHCEWEHALAVGQTPS